ncbi:hypothetical protein [Aeoliella mucimassa]|uniref:Uncharacterized protein n=1 Tax=Aeoliella mucimassa TaxID=2527972 RepID=A0A518AIT0_9BACT|nr:hypothetical protein [Aeoliella mucimassa]QDU54645.1 hypothetical protein Pan181_08280 [Aeoliella mucimassa]
MRAFSFVLMVALHVFGAASVASAEKHASEPAMAAEVKSALEWLSADTETFVVAKGPLVLFPTTENEESTSDYRDMPSFLFTASKEGKLQDILGQSLRGKPALFAIEGSRNFHPLPEPDSDFLQLGMIHFEGCQFLFFDNKLQAEVAEAFQHCLTEAKQQKQIAGKSVAIFHGKKKGDGRQRLLAHPQPNLLVCATDEAYLAEVLKRMAAKTPNARRALPMELPEWKWVDTVAEVWGLRHYARPQPPSDPTSPLGGTSSTDRLHDPAAIGLVLAYNAKSELVVHYLTKANDAAVIASEAWQFPGETSIKITPAVEGVMKIQFPRNCQNPAIVYLLMLSRIGHAIYL